MHGQGVSGQDCFACLLDCEWTVIKPRQAVDSSSVGASSSKIELVLAPRRHMQLQAATHHIQTRFGSRFASVLRASAVLVS